MISYVNIYLYVYKHVSIFLLFLSLFLLWRHLPEKHHQKTTASLEPKAVFTSKNKNIILHQELSRSPKAEPFAKSLAKSLVWYKECCGRLGIFV